MPVTSPVISDFTRGELSSRMDGRSDSPEFYRGVATLENWIVLPQGGTERRPGTIYFDEVQDSAKRSRLIPFVFDEDTTFVLEFYDGGIRIIHVSSSTREFITTEYTLTLDVAPGSDWPEGSEITGATSATFAAILKKNSATEYVISAPSGTWTLGEVINGEDEAGAANNADQGAAHPTVATDTVTSIVVAVDGAAFYGEADLPSVRYVQAGSQMAFAAPGNPPKLLTYFSSTGWLWADLTIEVPEWKSGAVR